MKKIRVLMIDDNKQLVDMVKEYFSSHAVISLDLIANDGVEGLEVINNHLGEFDLILLDLISLVHSKIFFSSSGSSNGFNIK